ncbi:secreted frizzled-related protein 3 [Nematostella vectensis]|uniref:secreted frizzled-related protein 3 n=1 Tax=Nematostella vectensis TaxID=45351 RepID=UPI00138FB949|nr:secreted frizzled-related protein 3 [Nematostella vectensis]
MIALAVLVLFMLEGSEGLYAMPNTCQPITVPACQSLPYNMTRLPNHLGHTSQRQIEHEINEYSQLISANCSADLVFLLCVYHLPICAVEFEKPVLPCRSLCRQVKRDCAPIIGQFSDQRSRRNVNCNDMPAYETGVCVQPESFLPHVDDGDPANARARDMGSCSQCSVPVALDFRSYKQEGYKFAVRAEVVSITYSSSGNRVISVDVKKVLKYSKIKIYRGLLRLTTNSSCPCPQMETGQTYLITGYENSNGVAHYISQRSYVKVWRKRSFSPELRNLVKHWEQERRMMNKRRKPRGI